MLGFVLGALVNLELLWPQLKLGSELIQNDYFYNSSNIINGKGNKFQYIYFYSQSQNISTTITMSLFCCSNPKTNQNCRRHPNHLLTLFCSNKNCMEPLCTGCVDEHQKIHAELSIGAPIIIDIKQVEDYMIDCTKKQIGTIQQTKDKIHKPVEVIYRFIDRFFYGSTERREKILRERFRAMVSNYNAFLLVSSIQADHQFSLTKGFKQRYFQMLDQLLDEVARNNDAKQLTGLTSRTNSNQPKRY